MTDTRRGDSPPNGGGVAPSIFGPVWMKLNCPNCGEPMKAIFCRLSGIAPHGHRYPFGDGYCRLLVVVEKDFAPPRIIVLKHDEDPTVVMQREGERMLALRKAS